MGKVYLALGLLAFLGLSHWFAYHEGESAASHRAELKITEATAEAKGKAAAAEAETKRVREEAKRTQAKLEAERQKGREEAKGILDANPEFAATSRPPALSALRVRELETIRRAAGHD